MVVVVDTGNIGSPPQEGQDDEAMGAAGEAQAEEADAGGEAPMEG